jgi:hypothetical protein
MVKPRAVQLQLGTYLALAPAQLSSIIFVLGLRAVWPLLNRLYCCSNRTTLEEGAQYFNQNRSRVLVQGASITLFRKGESVKPASLVLIVPQLWAVFQNSSAAERSTWNIVVVYYYNTFIMGHCTNPGRTTRWGLACRVTSPLTTVMRSFCLQ